MKVVASISSISRKFGFLLEEIPNVPSTTSPRTDPWSLVDRFMGQFKYSFPKINFGCCWKFDRNLVFFGPSCPPPPPHNKQQNKSADKYSPCEVEKTTHPKKHLPNVPKSCSFWLANLSKPLDPNMCQKDNFHNPKTPLTSFSLKPRFLDCKIASKETLKYHDLPTFNSEIAVFFSLALV